jgi:hypothetical protein
VVRLAGAIVVCAVAAFAAAFYAAGAGQMTMKQVKPQVKAVPFADTAARGVAAGFAGHPDALKLPPPPVKHHATPPPVAPVTSAPITSAPSTPIIPSPPPPTPKHKRSGGGTPTTPSVTVVGP